MGLGVLAAVPAIAGVAGALFGGGGNKGSSFDPGKNQGFGTISGPLIAQLLGTKLTTHGPPGFKISGAPSVFNGLDTSGSANAPLIDALRNFAFNGQGPSQAELDLIGGLTSGAQGQLNSTLGTLSGNQGRIDQLFGSAGGLFNSAGRPGFSINPGTLQASPVDLSQAIATAGQIAELDPRLLETGFPTQLDPGLLATGNRVDASPLFATATSEFQRNALPQIAETVGATGGGLQSQGFIDSAGRVAQNLLDEAARQNVQLAESAAGRRSAAQLAQGQLTDAASQRRAVAQFEQAGFIDAATARKANAMIDEAQLKLTASESAKQRDLQRAALQEQDAARQNQSQLAALGLQGNLLSQQNQSAIAQLGLGPAFASDILGLNQSVRNEQSALAARPLSVLGALGGLSGGGPSIINMGFNPQGSGQANLLGSLTSGISGITGLLNSLGIGQQNNSGSAAGTGGLGGNTNTGSGAGLIQLLSNVLQQF